MQAFVRSWLRDNLARWGGQPGTELGHQRRAQLLTHGEPLGSGLAVEAALNVEQRVEPLHCLECDGVNHTGPLAAALLAGSALNVSQLEELASGVREATGL